MQVNSRAEANVQYEINRNHTFQPCFETNSSFISKLLFQWSYKIIQRGNQKTLDMQDLSDLRQNQQPKFSQQKFTYIFSSLDSKQSGKLFTSFRMYLGFGFYMSGILAIAANLLQFAGPIAIKKILNFLKNHKQSSFSQNSNEGFIWVTILMLCYLLRTIMFQHSMHWVNLNCVQVLNSANSLIFNKIMKFSSSSQSQLDAGSILNHVNIDVMSFYFFIMMGIYLFSSPVMIIVATIMLIIEVGWIGLAVPLLFLIAMILQQKILKKGFQMRKDQLKWSDKRSKFVNQYFSGIRIIKYYGWEKLVYNNIDKIRQEELQLNFKGLMIRTYVEVMMNMLPILSSIVVFSVYVAIWGEESLNSTKVFTVLAIFNLIVGPTRLIVLTLVNYMNGKASLDRVETFLNKDERCQIGINTDDGMLQKGEIILKECQFNWSKVESQQNESLLSNHQQKQKRQKYDQSSQYNQKSKKKLTKIGHGILAKRNKRFLSEFQNQRININKYSLTIGNLTIKKNQLVSVVGKVGSGKSTLLFAILGQIDKVAGQVSRKGKIAYIPQTSWLRNDTIRQNILFEEKFQQQKYEHILQICQLKHDIQLLEGGDLTEIGQKGVNLSGGQKQRISIARAVYSDADIFLIDDCLHALDAYVGKNIFNNVIKNYLQRKGKTIVFVTNSIDYAEQCDRVIVLQSGKIVEDGQPKKLMNLNNSLFKQLRTHQKNKYENNTGQQNNNEKKDQYKQQKFKINVQEKQQKQNLSVQHNQAIQSKKEKQFKGLIKVQQRLRGSVPWSFYFRFFTGPGKIATFLMIIFILFAQLARVGSDWWLGQWSNNIFGLPQKTYIWVYAVISLDVLILLYLKGIFFAKFIISTSKNIQNQLIRKLLQSPLSWFDVTPTGRILARTTKDQDELDNNLSFNVQNSAQNIFILLSSVILVSIATPLYLIVACISGFIYYKLIQMYMNSSREIKRLQSNTRAPLISLFQETISGVSVIRAFGKQSVFLNKFFIRQKNYIVSIVNQNIATRWINLMTDIFSVITIAAAGYLGIVSVIYNIGPSNSNLIGLALVWSLQINSVMPLTIKLLANTQSNMNAVVRLYDYIDNNPQEKDFDEPKPKRQSWPEHGVFHVNQVSYKYRPQLPYVIKRISFDIKQKSKIGIVGRTGSGKSTITLGLLRILQIAQNQDGSFGDIQLDGQNIGQLGLHCLRHKLVIIPQDPVLFSGTIKTNIDPFDEYTDEQIAECLQKVEIWNDIRQNQNQTEELKRKLYSQVNESGNNFSLGQKQLLCMARAIVRKPKILLMDEATASIDEKTDYKIQRMIRTQLINTTVITIAHRLNTIMQYDQILVLNDGQVEEYDTPYALVNNPHSFLGKIIREVGKDYTTKMIHLAKQAF